MRVIIKFYFLFFSQIGDEGICTILNSCRKLKNLSINYITKITEKTLISISENLSLLEGLEISGLDELNFEFLTVLKKNKKLSTLLIDHSAIKDSDLIFLKDMENLRKISFFGN